MSLSRAFSGCLLAIVVCSSGAYAQGIGGGATLFEGARLIVGDGSAIENSAFLVQGDSVTWVGKRGERQASLRLFCASI